MSGTGELSSITEDLDQVAGAAVDDIARADALEAEASRIKSAAPQKVDEAIHVATQSLMALATPEVGRAQGRELLEAVLRINQHIPSRVISHGSKDIHGILERFDRLEEGTPAMLNVNNTRGRGVGVVADEPVSVGVSISQGMGGLPQADISFGFREMVLAREQPARLTNDAETITISHSWLRNCMIGETAIQGSIDGAEMQIRTYPSGFREVTNIGNLRHYAREVSGLMAVSGTVFDTAHLEETIEKAEALNASERTEANQRAAYRRRHNIPTRYR